jgi:hypothetical protein
MHQMMIDSELIKQRKENERLKEKEEDVAI